MAHAGISILYGPNLLRPHRAILREWENKPFYWVGPDGKTEVLVWISVLGLRDVAPLGRVSVKLVEDFCAGLEQRGLSV